MKKEKIKRYRTIEKEDNKTFILQIPYSYINGMSYLEKELEKKNYSKWYNYILRFLIKWNEKNE